MTIALSPTVLEYVHAREHGQTDRAATLLATIRAEVPGWDPEPAVRILRRRALGLEVIGDPSHMEKSGPVYQAELDAGWREWVTEKPLRDAEELRRVEADRARMRAEGRL